MWREGGKYLADGRGTSTSFLGFVPEDMYCLPRGVVGAIL